MYNPSLYNDRLPVPLFTLFLEVQATGSKIVNMKLLFCAALVVVLAQAHATSLSLNAQFAGFKHTHSKKYADAFEEVQILFIEAYKRLTHLY